jgi:hypothetical protein
MERQNGGLLMKKNVLVLALIALLAVVPMICFAEAMDQNVPDYQSSVTQTLDVEITPLYTYTSSVTATLSFSNGKANCSGSVTPSGTDDVSLTVTLYQKNGSSWNSIASWSSSSTNGYQAAAGGSVSVGAGTYKVTTVGNVGNGLERPTKSVTRTK